MGFAGRVSGGLRVNNELKMGCKRGEERNGMNGEERKGMSDIGAPACKGSYTGK